MVTVRALGALQGLDRHELVRSLVRFGFDSLPLGALVSVFTGGILVLLADLNVSRYGARAIVGWAAGYTVLREFGPLFVALVMTGRVGARNAAELASMGIGGQLEGLRGVGEDPFALLVAPRVAASTLGIGLLGTACSLVAILFAAIFGKLMLDIDLGLFFRSFAGLLSWRDLVACLVKTFAFGAVIALVSTRCGLMARGGAQAVGRAAATAVVSSAAVLTAIDWLLTLALAKVLG
ncbi:MAG: ABC transporter permease [Deltaproteobacteria bacterium]|nr:ABC transporter permease [Deltaproteobacteria bacterium]